MGKRGEEGGRGLWSFGRGSGLFEGSEDGVVWFVGWDGVARDW